MVKRELYWRAIYEDDTELLQYGLTKDGKTKENKYPDIDRERLVRFDLLDFNTNKAVFSLWLNAGQQLIYRRRTLRPVIVTEKRPIQVIWLVGYKHTVLTPAGPKSFIVMNYIYQDGSVALDGARDNLELYPIER